jgi:hypothetical protein
MTIYSKRPHARVYRKIYEDHYGPIPKEENGRSYEIHHIDGDHSNNNPSNLKAVTIQEHYDIHNSQGDWYACLKIGNAMRLSPEELSDVASKNSKRVQKERLENGTHHFLNSEFQSKVNRIRVENGTHNFLDGTIARKAQQNLVENKTHHFLIRYTCPHCERSGKGPSFKKWHFDKCKLFQ